MSATQQQKRPSGSALAGIAVGSNASNNIPATLEMVVQAISRVESLSVGPVKLSRFYQTDAFPEGSGPDFVNAALVIQYESGAEQLLADLHKIEADFGRVRTKRWGQRTIDLDLIFFDQEILPDVETYEYWHKMPLSEQMMLTPKSLVLPHPRLQDRSFVLVPLAEIAPEWRHPIFNETLVELRQKRPETERAKIRLIRTARPLQS